MFSAAMLLIAGKVLHGILLMAFMAFCAVSYITLTKGRGNYPTNLCVAGCILCGIAVDVIWSFMNFGSAPLLDLYGPSDAAAKIVYECIVAGTLFFCGLILTNIIRVKKYARAKTVLFFLFIVIVTVLLINTLSVKSLDLKISLPYLTINQTSIVFICLGGADVIALGFLMTVGKSASRRFFPNGLISLIIVILTVVACAFGIQRCLRNEREGPTQKAVSQETEYTRIYDIF